LTLCDLDERTWAGKQASLSGRIAFTRHGGAFVGESCTSSPPGVALLFPNSSTSPKVEFEVDPQSLQQLSQFFRPAGRTTTACGTLTGKIFYKKNFHMRHPGGGAQGNGYGARGALRWGFVLQSVLEIHTCE